MSEPLELVLGKLKGIMRSGDQWRAICPAHKDTEQSLTIGVNDRGDVLLHCFVKCDPGTICQQMGISMSDLYVKERCPTLSELSSHKKIPHLWLVKNCGLFDMDGNRGVGIPYQDEKRKLMFNRMRVKLTGNSHTYQPKGQKLQAYGVWRLEDARGAGSELVLVEGESDCWTLWHSGFNALGIPGATAWKVLLADHVSGFDRVVIWQEHGDPGEQFVKGMVNRLKRIGFAGEVVVARSEKFKDPSQMWCADQAGFPDLFREVVRQAREWAGPQKGKLVVSGMVEAMLRGTSGKGVAAETGSSADPCVPTPPTILPASVPLQMPGFYSLTDMGNAQRMVYRHGKDLRYCEKWGKWLTWDGRQWTDSQQGLVAEKAKETVLSIYAEASATQDDAKRHSISEHANRSESARSITAMMQLARSSQDIAVKVEHLDPDNWLLNCLNCTVDLRTGESREHRREDLITKLCPAAYDPAAVAPRWLAFLEQIFGGRADVIGYVQRLLGYCLTGDVGEQILPVFWGGGKNGKSTLINTLTHILGTSYAMHADSGLLIQKHFEGHPTSKASLFGKRLVVCVETGDGQRLNEPLVKQLTGGEPVTARRMREDEWTFDPTHKILLCTNHKPVIHGGDMAIWRRIWLVPFTVTIPPESRDPDLKEKLLAEADGILAWCVRGCLEWKRQGLNPPSDVSNATEEYRQEQDRVGDFLGMWCDAKPGDLDKRVRSAELYKAYCEWCEENCEKAVSKNVFGSQLASQGYKPDRVNGIRVWCGITLLDAMTRLTRPGTILTDLARKTSSAVTHDVIKNIRGEVRQVCQNGARFQPAQSEEPEEWLQRGEKNGFDLTDFDR